MVDKDVVIGQVKIDADKDYLVLFILYEVTVQIWNVVIILVDIQNHYDQIVCCTQIKTKIVTELWICLDF